MDATSPIQGERLADADAHGRPERLAEAHARLGRLAERRGYAEVVSGLEDAARRLRETTFRLAVLGEYKRGKSTLINALLRRPVLPMGVIPLTSIVTEIRYGREPGVTIEFLDGRARDVPPADLALYVTEPENPRNRKGVRRAIVRDSAPFLAEGVVVLDTPGIGSVFDHNTETTYESLEEADAVLIVLAADQPLSAEERSMLRALSNVTQRILYVVNRVDLLSAADLEASLRFVRTHLAQSEQAGSEPLFPLSARAALEATLAGRDRPPEFERFSAAVRVVLIGRKASVLQERALTITRRSLDLVSLRLESELQATRLAESDLDRAMEHFRREADGIAERLDQSVVLLKHRVARIHEQELRTLGDQRRERLEAELWPPIKERLLSRDARRGRGWADHFALDVGRRVVEELRPFYRETESFVTERFDRAMEEHLERVRDAIRETVETANRLLGMRAEVPPALAPLSERPTFYFTHWDGSGGQFRGSRLWLRLPRRLGERRVVLQFRELLDRRVRQNIAAIRYDWGLRLGDAVRVFEASSREQLDATRRVITDALDAARRIQAERDAEERAGLLARDLEDTRAIATSLTAVRPAE